MIPLSKVTSSLPERQAILILLLRMITILPLLVSIRREKQHLSQDRRRLIQIRIQTALLLRTVLPIRMSVLEMPAQTVAVILVSRQQEQLLLLDRQRQLLQIQILRPQTRRRRKNIRQPLTAKLARLHRSMILNRMRMVLLRQMLLLYHKKLPISLKLIRTPQSSRIIQKVLVSTISKHTSVATTSSRRQKESLMIF